MAKKISTKTIETIKLLKKKGFSTHEIKKKTHVGYGTAYRYAKDVQILPKYKKAWQGKRGGSLKRSVIALLRAKKSAKKMIPALSKKEKIILVSALYWGEGSKNDFSISNTDPDLIRVIASILNNTFKIPKENFRVSIRLYEDLDRNKCLNFWSKIIGIKPEKFVSVNILEGKKKGKLSYGMCRFRLKKGGDMLKYVKAINKEILDLV